MVQIRIARESSNCVLAINPERNSMIRIKHVLPLILALAGCAPYVLAVRETYEVATDPRSVLTQATDTQAEVQIKAAILASPVNGTSGIDVYCRQGVVVLVGVVPPGSQPSQAAVAMRVRRRA